jgi:tripartite-type tricarboxylate transporter receptor subunit TctC
MGLAVSPTLQVNTLKEFVDATRSNPNKFNYSSPGQGSIQHLAMELFMQDSGLQMLHVPYKGAAGAVTDLIAGIDQASVISLVTASSFIRNGQIKLLAVMGEERNPAFANVPTMKEAGYPNMIVETWYGVLAPASTPADVVKRINSEINEILLLPEVKEAMQKQGAMLVGGDPDRFKDLLKKEVTKWSKLMTNPRIKVN